MVSNRVTLISAVHSRHPVVVLTRSRIHSVFDTSVDDTALDGRPPTLLSELGQGLPAGGSQRD